MILVKLTGSLNFLGDMVTPLAMTVLGMKFADIQMSKLFTNKKIYYLSIVRLVISPILIVGVLLLINSFAYVVKNDFL